MPTADAVPSDSTRSGEGASPPAMRGRRGRGIKLRYAVLAKVVSLCSDDLAVAVYARLRADRVRGARRTPVDTVQSWHAIVVAAIGEGVLSHTEGKRLLRTMRDSASDTSTP